MEEEEHLDLSTHLLTNMVVVVLEDIGLLHLIQLHQELFQLVLVVEGLQVLVEVTEVQELILVLDRLFLLAVVGAGHHNVEDALVDLVVEDLTTQELLGAVLAINGILALLDIQVQHQVKEIMEELVVLIPTVVAVAAGLEASVVTIIKVVLVEMRHQTQLQEQQLIMLVVDLLFLVLVLAPVMVMAEPVDIQPVLEKMV